LGSGAAQARILYARALLARYMRDVNKYESLISVIPDAAKPEEMSPMLLATLGDMLRKKGDVEKAEAYYSRLREAFPTSDYGDRAPVGLGEIAYDRKEYDKALQFFTEAIEKYEGSSSMLDATLGKAKSLLALNKLELAEKLYNTILYTKEWRSAQAVALYNLGQIYEKKKEWGKAITYYTRVILAHQKYKDWLAKSYLQGAKCWLNQGKADEARKMLQEMLRRTDIQDQPEFNEAQAELAKMASS
jgi:tetratricopeptide (TPR) repeat protein